MADLYQGSPGPINCSQGAELFSNDYLLDTTDKEILKPSSQVRWVIWKYYLMRNRTKNDLIRGDKTYRSSKIAVFRYSVSCRVEKEMRLVSASQEGKRSI